MADGRYDDRCVHGFAPGIELVRYERAGKWYLEPTEPSLKRQHVKLAQAVEWAVWAMDNGTVLLGKPGGTQFDAQVRARLRRGTPTPLAGDERPEQPTGPGCGPGCDAGLTWDPTVNGNVTTCRSCNGTGRAGDERGEK